MVRFPGESLNRACAVAFCSSVAPAPTRRARRHRALLQVLWQRERERDRQASTEALALASRRPSCITDWSLRL
eukprot:222945-Pleurochrysis_carterae.AAC.2